MTRLKPQNLAFAAVVAVLFALTWLALDITDRVATASDSIEHSHLVLADLASLRAQAEEAVKARYADMMSLEWQSLDRIRAQLNEDLRELQLAIAGAMAAGILLLIMFLWPRAGSATRFTEKTGGSAGSSTAAAAAGEMLLEDLGKLLQSSADYADAYQVVQRCAAGMFPNCSGALYLAVEPGGALKIKTSWGKTPNSSEAFAAADCWAIRRGGAFLADAASDIACGHMHQPPQAPSLCVPVMGQGAALGILLLEDPEKSGALGSLRAVATHFASQIGLGLANMKLQETVRNLSVRDPLTGLFNRRYMEESLTREIAAARRNSRSLGVAICDLNRFKRFNDTFGSEAGDYALREIAQLIIKHIRASDIACRYGRDEIALILPEAAREGVVRRANQLRDAIFTMNLRHLDRQLEKVSVSFGVSMYPQHGKTSGELLQQAELALAGAKEFGNNRVQVAGPGQEPHLKPS